MNAKNETPIKVIVTEANDDLLLRLWPPLLVNALLMNSLCVDDN